MLDTYLLPNTAFKSEKLERIQILMLRNEISTCDLGNIRKTEFILANLIV